MKAAIQAKAQSISQCLILMIGISTNASFAGTVSFVPNGDSNAGSIKCDATLKALGALALKNGSVIINGKVIKIKSASEFLEAAQPMLVGSVLRTEANTSSTPYSITGLACFLLGDALAQIDDPSTPDVIFRNAGQLQGRILGIDKDCVVLALPTGSQERVTLASILYIRSPRVFVFKINTKGNQPALKDSEFQAEIDSVVLRPTAAPRSVSLSSVVPQKPGGNTDGTIDMGSLTGAKQASPMSLFEEAKVDAPKQSQSQKIKQRMQLPDWLDD